MPSGPSGRLGRLTLLLLNLLSELRRDRLLRDPLARAAATQPRGAHHGILMVCALEQRVRPVP